MTDSVPRAVRIVDLPDSTAESKMTPELILDRGALTEILDKIKNDHPVGVLCVTGPQRTGKSFLLNLKLRYLHSLHLNPSTGMSEPNKVDWIGQHSLEKLSGFTWLSAVDKVTRGIWLWSEPIPVTGRNGQEFNLLLMDTQGIFDGHTGPREWAMIIGLSLVMSSTLIFNVQNRLDSSHMDSLEAYLSVGTSASHQKEEGGDLIKFQKLIFLVRDWVNITQFSFGLEGGEQFLKESFFNPQNLKPENWNTRKNILSLFDTVQCCLMSKPGDRADDVDFDGVAGELKPQFVEGVRDFVEQVLSPGNFPLMKIGGDHVRAKEYLGLFEQFVQEFNKTPTFASLCSLREDHLIQSQVNRSLAHFRLKFEEILQVRLLESHEDHKPYIKPKDVEAAGESAQKEALQSYKNSTRQCSTEKVSGGQDNLVGSMGTFLKTLIMENELRKKEMIQESLDLFQGFLSGKNEAGESTNTFVDPELFQNMEEKARENSKQYLLQSSHRSEDYIREELETLLSQLGTLETQLGTQNKVRMLTAKENLTNKCNEWIHTYKSTLTPTNPDSSEVKNLKYVPVNSLATLHLEASKQVIDAFTSYTRSNSFPQSFIQIPLKDLKSRMTESYSFALEKNFNRWGLTKQALLTQFRDQITSKLVNGLFYSPKVFSQIFNEIINSILSTFAEECGEKSLNNLKDEAAELTRDMNDQFSFFEASNRNNTEKEKEKLKTILQDSLVILKKFLDDKILQPPLMGENEATKIYEEELKKLRQKMSRQATLGTSPKGILHDYVESRISRKAREIFQTLWTDRTQLNEKFMQKKIASTLEDYKKVIEQCVQRSVTDKDFSKKEKKARDQAKSKLASSISVFLGEETVKIHLHDLETQMHPLHQNCLGTLRRRQGDLDKYLEQYATECRTEYETQMTPVQKSGGYLVEAELMELHTTAKSMALSRFDHCLKTKATKNLSGLNTTTNDQCKSAKLKFSRDLDAIFKTVGDQNEKNLDEIQTRIHLIIQEVKAKHENLLDFDATNEQDFKKSDPTARAKTLDFFKEKLALLVKSRPISPTVQSELVSSLSNRLPSFYAEALKTFTDNLVTRNITRKTAYEHVQKEYNVLMENYLGNKDFVKIDVLDKQHERITTRLIEKIKADGLDLSPNDQTELRQDFRQLYKVFQDKNKIKFETQEVAIGIDLGTTNSAVAYHFGGVTKVFEQDEGGKLLPSFIFYDKECKAFVGQLAKKKASVDPKNTVYEAKRLLGRRFEDPIVQSDVSHWGFDVEGHSDNGTRGLPQIKIQGKKFAPNQISAEVLKELKKVAEKGLNGRKVRNAVITVPAYFNDGQRLATEEAGRLAGLKVLNLISEPTAAIMAHPILQSSQAISQTVLLYDLGGGTYDISLVKMSRGEVKVLGVGGDTHLGGGDFDNALVDHCIAQFNSKANGQSKMPSLLNYRNLANKMDINERVRHFERLWSLKEKCEEAKVTLSRLKEASVILEKFYEGRNLDLKVTREEFVQLNGDLFQKTIDIMNQVVKDAQLEWKDVNFVHLVGGSTRIPRLKTMIASACGGKDKILESGSKDEIVAEGAAVYAAILNGEYQAREGYIKVSEVTPLSLGVESMIDEREGMSVIIPKNTPVPCSQSKVYQTIHDNQTTVYFPIYQGEDPVATNNYKLGEVSVQGLTPAPKGQEKFNCIMTLDASGILHVEAVSKTDPDLKNEVVIERHEGRK